MRKNVKLPSRYVISRQTTVPASRSLRQTTDCQYHPCSHRPQIDNKLSPLLTVATLRLSPLLPAALHNRLSPLATHIMNILSTCSEQPQIDNKLSRHQTTEQFATVPNSKTVRQCTKKIEQSVMVPKNRTVRHDTKQQNSPS